VYGREIDGRETTFGTTGYTFNSTFVLYDRETESLWYPLTDGAMTAVSGARQTQAIPFIEKPAVMVLEEWKRRHPDSLVLLPDV
jgi:hypothetical protein